MRWPLVGIDKSYLQEKNCKETPNDNRDIDQGSYKQLEPMEPIILEPIH